MLGWSLAFTEWGRKDEKPWPECLFFKVSEDVRGFRV